MNICKNLILISGLLLGSFTTNAQPAQINKAVPLNDITGKLDLAKELIQILEINKSVEQSFFGAERQLKRNLIGKEEKTTSQNKKVYAVAKLIFDKQKQDTTKDILDQFSKEFANRFSEAELKYLIQLSKYPVYKKYKAFLESDNYYALISKPLIQVDKITEESRKEILSTTEKK